MTKKIVKEKVFAAIDPEGNVKHTTSKQSEMNKFAEENGICSAGWVSLSIRREIPVLMGLGKDAEVTPEVLETFEPRTTAKYSGNYWKFTKEVKEVEVPDKEPAAEVPAEEA